MRPEAPAVESPTVRPRRPGSRPRPDRKDRRRRVALEGLEPRTLMAVLPPPTILGRSVASTGGIAGGPGPAFPRAAAARRDRAAARRDRAAAPALTEGPPSRPGRRAAR